MKIKVIHNFKDKEKNLVLRNVGDVLEVTEERGNKLISFNLAEKHESDKIEKKEAAK